MNNITSSGFQDGSSEDFAIKVQQIAPLALFTRAIPKWVNKTNISCKISVECEPGMDGVGILISFGTKNITQADADEFINILVKTSSLMDFENSIEALRGGGGNEDVINQIVEIAEKLAIELS